MYTLNAPLTAALFAVHPLGTCDNSMMHTLNTLHP